VRKRSISAAVCCGLALSLVAGANSAGATRTPRLLINAGRTFRARPATIVVGMVAITGSKVTASAYRAGRHGHIRWLRWSSEAIGRGRAWVPNGPGGGVRPYPAAVRAWGVKAGRYTRLWWAYGVGSHRYQEWDKLLRFGSTYDWRVVRWSGSLDPAGS
jgi:hypothetical protein